MEWERKESSKLPPPLDELGTVELHAHVPTFERGAPEDRIGEYHIWIQQRPSYCDRGDWLIGVDPSGKTSLDGADGFPRYFFGDENEVKRQMETWVARRQECRSANNASG